MVLRCHSSRPNEAGRKVPCPRRRNTLPCLLLVAVVLNVDELFADGCMGATEFAFKIRKRYQTNELAVDSTEFGTRGSEVQILSPRPIFPGINQLRAHEA
jgi:hypothetical protein